ncbi:unannotated protein [freshwater metagenome]|uniref:Unannotated protein n=1 Tax=freshwater metagenome TaxID=449393 RepID=A0A6J7IGE9_9ZZZZ
MARHVGEFGEVVHDLIDMLDVLALELEARTGDAGADEHRDIEFAGLRVDRVHLLVVDGHLREASSGEHADAASTPCLVGADNLLDALHSIVGIGADRGDESIRVTLDRVLTGGLLSLFGAATDTDHADADAPLVHLIERESDRIGGLAQFLLLIRRRLEHVLSRELELVLGLCILGLLGDEGVLRLEITGREADHRVDGLDIAWHGHWCPPGRIRLTAIYGMSEVPTRKGPIAERPGPLLFDLGGVLSDADQPCRISSNPGLSDRRCGRPARAARR